MKAEASMVEAAIKPRLAYLDNLKLLMIVFVVITHAAITYGGEGNWYYKEHTEQGAISLYSIISFQTFIQAFFMSLLFMIAGYFVPASFDKKGSWNFISDRMARLGIPALIYMLFINPLCAFIADPSITEPLHRYAVAVTRFEFLCWSGPMWFTLALLIFSISYVMVQKWCGILDRSCFAISIPNVSILVLLITVVAFALRLFFPIGTTFLNFQLGYFSAYIFMFVVGIMAYRQKLFDSIDYDTAKKWLFSAFGFGIPIWTVLWHVGVSHAESSMNGGVNGLSFSFALWESFICVAMCIALIGIFKKQYNSTNRFYRFLSSNAFGVYFFHSPILVAMAILLQHVSLPPIIKCFTLAALVLVVTFIFVGIVRSVPLFRKIFS
jgi:surface polysaccharide O-acyltransferase-like enzyme